MEMRLRELMKKDAPLMLEWMHDPEVVNFMQANFAEKTLQDCEAFIEVAHNSTEALHMAVVDESDIYMGTVSLKNITKEAAEFAITMRKSAMGKGYAQYAMKEIIRIGLEELRLERIYWYVNSDNQRAVRFYDKQEYQRIAPSEIGGGYCPNRQLYLVSEKTNQERRSDFQVAWNPWHNRIVEILSSLNVNNCEEETV